MHIKSQLFVHIHDISGAGHLATGRLLSLPFESRRFSGFGLQAVSSEQHCLDINITFPELCDKKNQRHACAKSASSKRAAVVTHIGQRDHCGLQGQGRHVRCQGAHVAQGDGGLVSVVQPEHLYADVGPIGLIV